MEEFITTTYNNLQSKQYDNLTLVLGNESCDLDSAVSSLVYASYLHWQYNKIKCRLCTKAMRDEAAYKDDIFVPVLNVDRQDFSLKTEIVYLLQEYGIQMETLIFSTYHMMAIKNFPTLRNDYNLPQLVEESKTTVVLVDHHALASKDQFLAPYVAEVIDHRPLDNSKWAYKDDTRSTMELVGSCATLVADRIRTLSGLIGDTTYFTTFGVCLQMLHSTIILDTVNFSKVVNKATDKDREIVAFLEEYIRPADPEEYRKSRLERLESARCDVTSLTASQLLKKDYKVIGKVFVPSFPILVEEVLQRPGITDALQGALSQHGCRLALLLGMKISLGGRRDMAIYTAPADAELGQKLLIHLQSWSLPALDLQPHTLQTSGVLYCDQMNKAASRKQYVPALQAFDIQL